MDTYTPEQFAKSLKLRGYMSKENAQKYVAEHPKEVYTEDDFQRVWHEENLTGDYIRNKPIKGLASGLNMFDPEYWD